MSVRRAAVLTALAALASVACGQLLGLGDGDDEPDPGSTVKTGDAGDATTEGDTTVPVGDVDAGADAADAARRPRVVFVTRQTTTGAFGGLAGGDAICNAEALDAGLAGDGFVAWLSNVTGGAPVDAIDRLTTPDGGWFRVDGQQVFDGKQSIAAEGNPKVAIELDAWGVAVVAPLEAFTATYEDGRGHTNPDCASWTLLGELGVRGIVGATDKKWTNGVNDSCAKPGHLICFER